MTQKIEDAIDAAITALDDWTCVHAPEYCDENRVKEAERRIRQVGTVYYIATVLEQLREAKKELNENTN